MRKLQYVIMILDKWEKIDITIAVILQIMTQASDQLIDTSHYSSGYKSLSGPKHYRSFDTNTMYRLNK